MVYKKADSKRRRLAAVYAAYETSKSENSLLDFQSVFHYDIEIATEKSAKRVQKEMKKLIRNL